MPSQMLFAKSALFFARAVSKIERFRIRVFSVIELEPADGLFRLSASAAEN
jgi:hypothetical protein